MNLLADHAIRREISGTAQAVDPVVSAHTPTSSTARAEHDLRQLADGYMRNPGSQVNAVCMEQISAGRCKVTITLDVTGNL